jgi:PST family polysaccharide transporter
MTAETIKICGYLLGYILIAKTLIKSYIYLEFQNFILLGVLNFFLVKEYGAWGACVSHAITYIFYLLVGMYLLKSYLFTKDPL